MAMITVMTIAAPVLHREPKRDGARLRAVVTMAWVAKYAKCLLRVNYHLRIIGGRLRSVSIVICFNARGVYYEPRLTYPGFLWVTRMDKCETRNQS